MFTEGLNTDALRWVRETHRIDPISSGRGGGGRGGGGRGGGLPPVSKFRTGHVPTGAIHVSRSIQGDADDTGSGSDDDLTTDTEEEVYGGRYSLDSSPQTDRISNVAFAQKYGKPVQSRPHYASDYMYSDVSSSLETVHGRKGNVAEKFVRGNGRYQARNHGLMEEELSDSAGSSEISSTHVGIKNGTAPHTRAYCSDEYASTVPSQYTAKISVEKNHARNRQSDNELSDDEDVPSAPPLHDSAQKIKHGSEEVPASGVESMPRGTDVKDFSARNDSANTDVEAPPIPSLPGRVPTFHASALGPWHSVIAYESCVRLCLHAWSVGSMEAPMFMESECALLREAFSLQQVLLQPEEELLAKRTSELVTEGSAAKPKKIIGKMKVQVRKVKMALDPPTGCSMASIRVPSIKLETIQYGISNMQTTVSSRWKALRKTCAATRLPSKSSFSRQQLVHTSSRYLKQVSGLLKIGVTTLRNSSSSYEAVQETYSCSLRMKSSVEEDTVRMQPGSGETHVFFPDSLGDDLIIEVQDSTGKQYGRVVSQVATIAEDPADKIRWWSIYHEPEHELVGKIQLYINYSTSYDENNLKCGSVAETVAYDILLEVVMKVQHFQQRNLRLHGHWNWLLVEFAKYYGVSNIYTKLRYLSYIMDVATPTADCLNLVYDQLLPVVMKGKTLSHQENRIFGEIKEQLQQILALLFENYKSLDESSLSGMMEVFRPATGLAAPALEPAVKLYTLLHDILSPEAQTTLCQYFQAAAKKRSRRHLAETDEFVTNSNNTEGPLMDALAISTAYQKMKSVCLNIKNEIYTDIEIHEQHILPSFIDLPNLSSSIYNTELCSRLRAFLIACPPPGPSPFVAELVIVTSDFQRDLTNWNISPVKAGVDAKELFHLYIILWIQDKRLSMLDSCKLDKVKWSGVRTQHSTTPFVDDMYERLKETLTDYEIIICRWPEYTFLLENAIADIEKAIVEALDKQYADVLSPLKENLAPKMFGLQYVQKLAKRSTCPYLVPDEVGILLNSMKRMLDVLRPKIETQFKLWGSCIPDNGNTAPGERLSEVTVMLRAKFRNYLQAIVEKLSENTKSQNSTKLKKILQDSKENVVESDVRSRMQPLKDQLRSTINHLHTIFETHVFVALCKGYWDRMGQDVLSFLENRKENRSWYKGARVAVSVLDDIFASQMQELLGNSLQEKDIEPPRSIMEVRAILCKDAPDHKDNRYYY